jgi:CDP-4-dehydro-6-deoxyglucose reductase, E3
VLSNYLKKWFKPSEEKARFEPDPAPRLLPEDYQGTVAFRRLLTPNTLELGIAFPDDPLPQYLAGQYLNLVLPEDKENGLRRELRSYSLFSHPKDDGPLRIIAKLITGGRSSEWLGQLSEGDPISVVAPLGSFHLKPPLHSHLYFVVTGTGVVPIRAMIRELIETGTIHNRNVTLLWGLRSEEDLFGLEEYQDWAEQHAGFEQIVTLSAPNDTWSGARGRVTDYLSAHPVNIDDSQVYLCGNGAMVDDVIALLESQGLPRRSGRVFCEKFFDSPRSQQS